MSIKEERNGYWSVLEGVFIPLLVGGIGLGLGGMVHKAFPNFSPLPSLTSAFSLDNITNNVNKELSEIRIENIIGNKEPEKFYGVNGKRCYIEIDGKSIESYFNSNQQEK